MRTMLEKLSKLIHEDLWMGWAKTMLKHENISLERKTRWEKECFVPYEELSEPMKDLDRLFAIKCIDLMNGFVSDRYLNTNESIKRLVNDYRTHKSLFVAFDFDNTVFDFFGTGEIFPKLESVLIYLKQKGHKLILFTGNEGDKLKDIVDYCTSHGYKPDYVNENPIMKTIKPYYNILLDDRAGLGEAYQILLTTLNIIENEK